MEIPEIQRGDDARKNWETINQLVRNLRQAEAEIRRLSDAVADLRYGPKFKGGTGGTGGGMTFRGEWSASETYRPQDVVVIRGGADAGAYVCVTPPPADAPAPADPPRQPALGVYWVNLSRSQIPGIWA